MNYCERCRLAFPEDRCPNCGETHLRPVRADDPVFLIEKDALWSGLVRDLLQQHGVPFLDNSNIGAGLSSRIGSLNEFFLFYVPYAALEDARALMAEVFPPEGAE